MSTQKHSNITSMDGSKDDSVPKPKYVYSRDEMLQLRNSAVSKAWPEYLPRSFCKFVLVCNHLISVTSNWKTYTRIYSPVLFVLVDYISNVIYIVFLYKAPCNS